MALKKIFVAYVDIKTRPDSKKQPRKGRLKIMVLAEEYWKVQPTVENHLKAFLKEEEAIITRIKLTHISYDAFIQAK